MPKPIKKALAILPRTSPARDTSARLVSLLTANPALTMGELARTLGVTRQRVGQILQAEGYRTARRWIRSTT